MPTDGDGAAGLFMPASLNTYWGKSTTSGKAKVFTWREHSLFRTAISSPMERSRFTTTVYRRDWHRQQSTAGTDTDNSLCNNISFGKCTWQKSICRRKLSDRNLLPYIISRGACGSVLISLAMGQPRVDKQQDMCGVQTEVFQKICN